MFISLFVGGVLAIAPNEMRGQFTICIKECNWQLSICKCRWTTLGNADCTIEVHQSSISHNKYGVASAE